MIPHPPSTAAAAARPASHLAVVMDVDFCPPYSVSLRLMLRFSRDELYQLGVGQALAPRGEDVQPVIGHRRHRLVRLLQRVALEKGFGHLALEELDELELAVALDLKALELGQGAVRVVHRIAGARHSSR